ncbi:DUF6882 domain-containing protein [Sphingomonas canadensis]|uniref:DUF6882 domain-containing protein n=1 Tax=Sphingomonas canadensis TaxID=1219257 RepID=A0ABW3H5Y3_9SPHN|nr:DUF6882 domain-containing protein [Sphingomonas canadensis]MCW3835293.1 hypothetical protein [Sphingomonas canadensis]
MKERIFGMMFGARDDAEAEATLLRAMEELKAKTAAHDATWHLGESHWAVDMETGRITFTNRRGMEIVAPMQVIGTFNTRDDTWLWGWDHPSVPEPLAEHARLARAFGEKHGLERYTTRKIVASEAEAWEFTALACHLGGAQGAYRGPAGTTLVFMTFGELTMRKSPAD